MPDTRKEKLESVLAALDDRKAKMTRDQMMEVLGGKRQGRLNMPVAPRDGMENLPDYGEERKKEVLPQVGEASSEVALLPDIRKDGVRQPQPRRKTAKSSRLYEMMQ
jgi:hypothetical protein